jgi:hypothetical protein
MKVYTVKSLELYRKLEKEKVLFTDPTHPRFSINVMQLNYNEIDPMLLAYDWLKEMVPENPNNNYPWWAWKNRIDLRGWRFLCDKDKEYCLMTLEIDDNKVLLSHFQSWCMIINAHAIPLNDEEDNYFDSLKLPKYPEIHPEIKQTWYRIFDLDMMCKSEYWGKPEAPEKDEIQVCFTELRFEDVKKVQFFKGANKR